MCVVCDHREYIGKYVQDTTDPGLNLPAEGVVVDVDIQGTWEENNVKCKLVVETKVANMPAFQVKRDIAEIELIGIN